MTSYKNIIKTTGLIGGVQVLTLLFSLVKNKAVALLLGRDGVGLFGLFVGFTDMVKSFSTLGMNQSATRQVAKANAADDKSKIAKCIYILRRAVFFTSLAGASVMCLKARAISMYLFGTEDKMWAVMLISSVIIFDALSQGQQALLNGLRQIKALAMCRIIGAACSAVFTVVIVYLYQEAGIPLSLVAVALCNFVASWWFVRKTETTATSPDKQEAIEELKGLLGIGVSFAAAGMMASMMALVSRSYISDHFDVAILGEYMAAWTISNLYVGIILNAMGIDFMPRLAALLNDRAATHQVINEQIELGILAAGIGVLGVLVFAPLVLVALYSGSFVLAPEIIRWQILGVGLRVIAFPFGYALTIQGKGVSYVAIQSFFYVGEFLLLILFTRLFGTAGLGVNYFVGYIFYVLAAWIVCRMAIGFNASPLMLKILSVSLLFQLAAFSLPFVFPPYVCYSLGTMVIVLYALWAFLTLKNQMQLDVVTIVRNRFGGR